VVGATSSEGFLVTQVLDLLTSQTDPRVNVTCITLLSMLCVLELYVLELGTDHAHRLLYSYRQTVSRCIGLNFPIGP